MKTLRRSFRTVSGNIWSRLRSGSSSFVIVELVVCLAVSGWLSGCTLHRPLGGGSTNNPIPSLANGSLNPGSATAGGAAFTLTVTGSNFVSSSTVQWKGSARTTTFVSSTSLQAAVTAADIATAGTATVTVMTPAPGGGTSSPLTFTIGNPVPAATSLNPSTVLSGGAAFTLTVTGTNFISPSAIQWNGIPRTTTFVSSTSLQAAITAADIATAGTATVTVMTPAPGGGTSSGLSFTIVPFIATTVNQAAQDIVFDPVNNVIYLSVLGNAAANGNTISVLNPATGAITSSVPAGSNPDVLAISDNSQYLYAGIDGSSSVQRFTLPGVAKDIIYSLGSNTTFGPYFALDLQVAPGTPHTTAVTLGNTGVSPVAEGGITIFDDATARPTTAPGFGGTGNLFDSLQWGPNASALYAADNEDTAFAFYSLTVNSSGVTLNGTFKNTFSNFGNRIHFDAGTNLIYADDGHVVNPATGAPVGNFSVSGLMVPDATLNKAFFAVGPFNLSSVTIESFDLTNFTRLGSITIPNVTGTPLRLIRWGKNGLAFNTGGVGISGQVYLIQSNL
jgi:hypothetical protein